MGEECLRIAQNLQAFLEGTTLNIYGHSLYSWKRIGPGWTDLVKLPWAAEADRAAWVVTVLSGRPRSPNS